MNDFSDPFVWETGVYQFTMSHLEHGRLFRKDSDYIYGVNSLALATLNGEVHLLGYVLMSNHFHLLLKGTFAQCCEFYYYVIRRLRRLLSMEYKISGLLKENAFNVTAVTDDLMFVKELAYILRNPYRARLASPFSYPWSSADVYFQPRREQVKGIPFCTLNQMMQRSVFRGHATVPGDWEHVNGCILNRCFVDFEYAEKRLGDSLNFYDKLRVYDLESAVKLSHGFAETVRFSDPQLQEKIQVVCKNEYHVESVHQLDRKSLMLLARTLVRRFAATKGQVRRLLGLTDEVLERLL